MSGITLSTMFGKMSMTMSGKMCCTISREMSVLMSMKNFVGSMSAIMSGIMSPKPLKTK